MSVLKGVCHEIFRVLFWHVWIDLGLYKNLWLFLIFSVEPLILYLRLMIIFGIAVNIDSDMPTATVGRKKKRQ